MAWSWSHTIEAYDNVRANLSELSIGELQEIACEWKAARPDQWGSHTFSQWHYYRGRAEIKRQGWWDDAELMANWIWEHAEELATCTNGGWLAWVCPWGCHTVSFDRVIKIELTGDEASALHSHLEDSEATALPGNQAGLNFVLRKARRCYSQLAASHLIAARSRGAERLPVALSWQ